MRERETYGSEETLIPAALRLFYKVFQGSRIERCSLFTLSDSGLAIPEQYVHPNCTDPGYRIALRITEGVAGLVCSDALPRYVPRLSYPFAKRRKLLPAIPFPHAVKFESRANGEKLELVNEDLDAYAFKRPDTEPLFLSFVSVPLKPVGDAKCFGVLNFDFSKVDALDKSDIAMASVLGLLLADEVNRMRSQTKSEHLSAQQDHSDSRLPVKNELRDPTRPLIVSLGETATPGEHESLIVLDTPPFEISGQNSSTSEQGVSSYLTWSRVRAGWAPFKRKKANS